MNGSLASITKICNQTAHLHSRKSMQLIEVSSHSIKLRHSALGEKQCMRVEKALIFIHFYLFVCQQIKQENHN